MAGFAHSKRTNNFRKEKLITTSVTVRTCCPKTSFANTIKILIILFTRFNGINKSQEKKL